MPDNLTISIGADTSKARGELRGLQAELKNVNQQINAAVKAGDISRAKELSTTYGVMKDRAVALDRSLRELGASGSRAFNEIKRSADGATASLAGTGRGARRLVSELGSLRGVGGILGGLGGGGTATGVIGAGVGLGIEKLIGQFEDLAKSMREIRDLARETSGKPLVVQGMQELAKESGESAEKANKFLTGMAATLAKVATAKRDLQTGLPVGGDGASAEMQNFATFGDKTIQVLRGGIPVVRDFSDALAVLQVNQAQLVKLSPERQGVVLGEAFLRAEKNAKQLGLTEIQLNEISKQVFGVPAEDADKLIEAYAKISGKVEELRNSQRGATQEHLDNIDQVAKAQEKLAQQVAESTSKAANASKDARALFLLSLADFIKSVDTMTQKAADGVVSILQSAASVAGRFLRSLISSAEAATGPQGALGPAGPAGPATSASITLPDVNTTASRNPVNVFRGPGTGDLGGYGPNTLFGPGTGHGPDSFPTQSINPGLSDYQAPPPKVIRLLASGGMVRGPGTATSDSIVARLSAGEFVMRAAAVNRWGPRFMSAINGFADGGMVMPSRGIPSFAAGGMVRATTAGGVPVTLVFPGGSFALHGDNATVGSLTREARRAGMLAAGRRAGVFE